MTLMCKQFVGNGWHDVPKIPSSAISDRWVSKGLCFKKQNMVMHQMQQDATKLILIQLTSIGIKQLIDMDLFICKVKN